MSTFDPLFHSRFDSDTMPMEMELSVAEELDASEIHLERYEDESYTTVVRLGDVETLSRALR
jgi:hypothetical protein